MPQDYKSSGAGKDEWNSETGQWDKIHIFVKGGRDELIIHENRHGNQKLQKVNWTKLQRERDAYNYQQIYNSQSVKDFIDERIKSKYGHIQENIRPTMNLEEAIKYYYDIN